jgi:hypothetical protein
MSGIRDDSLDHIISNLNNIREQLEDTFQASNSSRVEDSPPPEEDTNSLALEAYLASRLQQIGEITSERPQVKGLQTGNGWNPDQIA